MPLPANRYLYTKVAWWLGGLLALFTLSLGLAFISNRFAGLQGWRYFVLVLLLGAGLQWIIWSWLWGEALPRWLGLLLVGASVLRLLAGIFWYLALPVWGYGSPPEMAGYVMADAYERDTAAWQMAQSNDTLLVAAPKYRQFDQYGGLLVFSSVIYRYLGGELHQPLLIVILTAAFSGLAVLFTWAFAKRVWGEKVAGWSAVLLAFYPEAVLLGSSQMREAFTISLAMASFFGLIYYLQARTWKGVVWLAGGLLGCLLLSPPVTVILLLLLILLALSYTKWRLLRHRRFWLISGLLLILALIGLWLGWSRFAPEGVSNPIMLIGWWIKQSARWQAYLTQRASGWIQKIFRSTPGWSHILILLGYGIVQPFLPAALVDDAKPIWQGIAIWRAFGWALILPFLFVTPIRAWGKSKDVFARCLSLVIWIPILVASYRGGGDQWDNARYRLTFGGLQMGLVAWTWWAGKHNPDAWMRRISVGLALILVWFMPWYLRRYESFEWPVVDVFKTMALGVFSFGLYFLWDWVRSEKTNERGEQMPR